MSELMFFLMCVFPRVCVCVRVCVCRYLGLVPVSGSAQ
jgi:hypothetical protein